MELPDKVHLEIHKGVHKRAKSRVVEYGDPTFNIVRLRWDDDQLSKAAPILPWVWKKLYKGRVGTLYMTPKDEQLIQLPAGMFLYGRV